MKTFYLILITLFSTACVADDKSNDLYMNFLLNIKSPGQNELMELKAREKIYLTLKNQVSKPNANISAIKRFLFIGFVAYNRNAASTMEAMSSDLMTVFNNNKQQSITILKELPFMTVSSCYYLGNYFGFEGKNKEDKPRFLSDNRKLIMQSLGKKFGQQCLGYIEKN